MDATIVIIIIIILMNLQFGGTFVASYNPEQARIV